MVHGARPEHDYTQSTMLANITNLTKHTKMQVYPKSSYGTTARARNAIATGRRPHALTSSTTGDDPATAAPTRRPLSKLLHTFLASSRCAAAARQVRM